MAIPNYLKISAYLATLCLTFGNTGCKKNKINLADVATSQNLKLIGAYPIAVKEPSGLSLAKDNQSLWTVSDTNGHIYQIDLKGAVLNHFPTGYDDLEAISTIDAQHLAFIAERDRKIVIARKDGTILEEAIIDIPGFDNKGPEALTYDEDAEEFHIMQESPGLLIKLNRQLEEISRRNLNVAEDYSSISFDSESKHLWVLSDRSRNINVLDENSTILGSFSADIEQMEGLAVDHENRLIYIISDPDETLYVLEFESY
ncbi:MULTISPECIES: SdiA-regulated domain-containing protein [unclassified Lentimonas]|uniref:SdiA-regulated domain-containing protein n=1 Tax=unclassified Lentimonas TaxID=2630993 RepID=UPI001320AD84|nr:MULTISPECIES: SdiA-regulated domain-containing protein [unclassified Lentimonas]CAA6676810.1 Unannotated [Lentimonas sp. CC4]CAA6686617.1 Unannotated [Lentimonas sp. CC6]CAA6696257.1 Unannotated [Lentimonas sp. CC10]CAA6697476.1 Unannotated [Lentimonas sp. CC19]CAA7071223.1 Unannotated [Lentimonas sp. CC11]